MSQSASVLPEAAATADPETTHVLRLFVTGATPRSARAISNLRRLCEERLAGQYDLEVIDLYQHPEAAQRHQIIAAPTLLKLLPEPMRRIIGDLSNDERILVGLGLQSAASSDDIAMG